jgi:DNA-binding transcriptional regulator YiaG
VARSPKVGARGAEVFDPINLDTEDLQIFNMCRDLSSAPRVEREGAPLRAIQDLYLNEDYLSAISSLRELLRKVPIQPRQPFDIDRERFVEVRALRKMTQQQLARALGVTAATICNFESRGAKLRLYHVLLAADWLDFSPAQVLRPSQNGRH